MPVTVLLATEDSDRWSRLEETIHSLGMCVRRAMSGEEAVKVREGIAPGLVLVSTDLPDVHALDVCRRIRRDDDVPLIVLSSAADEVDRVLALELGADDVIAAGCESDELRERVKAALRRGGGALVTDVSDEVLEFGEIVIDRPLNQLTVAGECRDLTPMETELLWMLARHAGEVVSSEELLEGVWGYPRGVKTRTLDVHIGRLRRKLGEDGRNPRFIITVRSVGYRFEPPQNAAEDEDGAAA